jgi:hypothetical protein
MPVKLGCPWRSIYQTMERLKNVFNRELKSPKYVHCEYDSPITTTRLFLGMAVFVVIWLISLIKRIKELSTILSSRFGAQ